MSFLNNDSLIAVENDWLEQAEIENERRHAETDFLAQVAAAETRTDLVLLSRALGEIQCLLDGAGVARCLAAAAARRKEILAPRPQATFALPVLALPALPLKTASGLPSGWQSAVLACLLVCCLLLPSADAFASPVGPTGRYRISRDGITLTVDTRAGTLKFEQGDKTAILTGLQIQRQGCKIYFNHDRPENNELIAGEIDLCALWGGGFVRIGSDAPAIVVFDFPQEINE